MSLRRWGYLLDDEKKRIRIGNNGSQIKIKKVFCFCANYLIANDELIDFNFANDELIDCIFANHELIDFTF